MKGNNEFNKDEELCLVEIDGVKDTPSPKIGFLKNLLNSKKSPKKQTKNQEYEELTLSYDDNNFKKGPIKLVINFNNIEIYNNGKKYDEFPLENFSNKSSKNQLNGIIEKHYFDIYGRNSNLSESKIYDIFKKDLDLNIFYALNKIDDLDWPQSEKRLEYADALLARPSARTGESSEKYEERLNKKRIKALQKTGIEIEYDLSNTFQNLFKGNFLQNIKTIRQAINAKKLGAKVISEIDFIRSESSDALLTEKNKVKSLNPAIEKTNKISINTKIKSTSEQAKIKFKAIGKQAQKAKTLMNKAKQNTLNLTKSKIARKLAISGFMSVMALGLLSTSTKSLTSIGNNVNIMAETKLNNTENNTFNQNIQVLESKINLKELSDIKTENIIQPHSDEIESSEPIEIIEEPALMVNLKDSLMESLQIGIGSEFTMAEGLITTQANGNGSIGNYKNTGKQTFKISKIFVVETGKMYSAKDNKTLSQIKAENPGMSLSYLAATEQNGNDVYIGWNKSTDNNIEEALIKNALINIKGNLSPETMQFLCDNPDLSASVDLNKVKSNLDNIETAVNVNSNKNINQTDDISR